MKMGTERCGKQEHRLIPSASNAKLSQRNIREAQSTGNSKYHQSIYAVKKDLRNMLILPIHQSDLKTQNQAHETTDQTNPWVAGHPHRSSVYLTQYSGQPPGRCLSAFEPLP